MLSVLIGEEASPTATGTDEQVVRAKIAEKEAKLDQLVDCLTPELVETIQPRMLALRREIDAAKQQLANVEEIRVSAAEAQALVEKTLRNTEIVAKTLTTASFIEKRDVVRALTSEILLDPKDASGRISFFAIPGVGSLLPNGFVGDQGATQGAETRGVGAAVNYKKPVTGLLVSVRPMAGARLSSREIGFSCRKSFVLHRSSIAA